VCLFISCVPHTPISASSAGRQATIEYVSLRACISTVCCLNLSAPSLSLPVGTWRAVWWLGAESCWHDRRVQRDRAGDAVRGGTQRPLYSPWLSLGKLRAPPQPLSSPVVTGREASGFTGAAQSCSDSVIRQNLWSDEKKIKKIRISHVFRWEQSVDRWQSDVWCVKIPQASHKNTEQRELHYPAEVKAEQSGWRLVTSGSIHAVTEFIFLPFVCLFYFAESAKMWTSL